MWKQKDIEAARTGQADPEAIALKILQKERSQLAARLEKDRPKGRMVKTLDMSGEQITAANGRPGWHEEPIQTDIQIIYEELKERRDLNLERSKAALTKAYEEAEKHRKKHGFWGLLFSRTARAENNKHIALVEKARSNVNYLSRDYKRHLEIDRKAAFEIADERVRDIARWKKDTTATRESLNELDHVIQAVKAGDKPTIDAVLGQNAALAERRAYERDEAIAVAQARAQLEREAKQAAEEAEEDKNDGGGGGGKFGRR